MGPAHVTVLCPSFPRYYFLYSLKVMDHSPDLHATSLLSVKTRQGKVQGIFNLQYHSLFKCHKTTNHIMLVLGYVFLNIIKY